jgi:carboxylesterase
MSEIIPTAEPFFFPGGPIGCLLVHGFTGTPKEMRWMGEYLAKKGYSVLGVRLAGHATHPADLLRLRWQDWLASVEDGWNLLRGVTPDIFMIGLSMGGILSLLFASQYPVRGVVAMSTPYRLPKDQLLRFARVFSLFLPTLPPRPSDWHDHEAERVHVCYPKTPTRMIPELRSLLAETRTALPKVSAPVLLVHSRQDGDIPPENMELIYQDLGSADKQMLLVENSGHNIPRDAERERVFRAAHEFIQRVANGSA